MPFRPHFIVLLALLCVAAASTRKAPAGPPQQADGIEALFDWSRARCETWDIPDTPARFWRGEGGEMHMVAGAERSRASLGPGLETLSRDCSVLYQGSEKADPAARDDRVWIGSAFTRDGVHVEALGHAEYHGHAHPGACAAGVYMACWRNAVVALVSSDGGRSFARVPGPPVAALPYRYDPQQSKRSGYFNPSNMIERDGFVYVFIFAEAYGAQARGVCLLRRPLDGVVRDWRAWDGRTFSVRFADPYTAQVNDPSAHVCAPLPGLDATLTSVVLQPATGRYLAVSPRVGRDLGGARQAGIWGYVSRDLIHWSVPVLLRPMPLLWARDCDADAAFAYPALVDPESPSRMLDRVGETFRLTLVRMKLDEACRVGPERDLIGFHVNWPAHEDAVPELQAPAPDPTDPRP